MEFLGQYGGLARNLNSQSLSLRFLVCGMAVSGAAVEVHTHKCICGAQRLNTINMGLTVISPTIIAEQPLIIFVRIPCQRGDIQGFLMKLIFLFESIAGDIICNVSFDLVGFEHDMFLTCSLGGGLIINNIA